MVEGLGIIGGSSGNSVFAGLPATAAAAPSDNVSVLPGPNRGVQSVDPISGVMISEQINSAGHIVAQNPPSFVLAYLRSGLEASGLPRQSLIA